MSSWELDFGEVSCWESESGSFNKYAMKMSYNSENELPFCVQTFYSNDHVRTSSSARSLKIKIINSGGLLSVSDELYDFTHEQLSMLAGIEGEWLYDDMEPKKVDLNTWIPNNYSKDIGIIFCYVGQEKRFMLAHLMIGFEWQIDNPYIFYATIFDEYKMPQYKITSTSSELDFSYQGEIEGLHHYIVCGQNCLLTTSQIDLLKTIRDLTKDD